MPSVDILIRGHNKCHLTAALLGSIFANTPAHAYQITYVDNGSDPGLLEELIHAPYGRAIQIVYLSHNAGSCFALNTGLQIAFLSDAPYVLFLDNDTEIPEGDTTWLQRWIEYMERDPEIGVSGATSNRVAGWQHIEALPDTFQRDWQADDGAGFAPGKFEYPLLASFAMMVRKDAAREVGLFDERYEPGNFEDYDYVMRLRQAGWKSQIASSVWVHHKGHSTFGEDLAALLQTNQKKFVEKFGIEALSASGIRDAGDHLEYSVLMEQNND